jgi:hypothetical protein
MSKEASLGMVGSIRRISGNIKDFIHYIVGLPLSIPISIIDFKPAVKGLGSESNQSRIVIYEILICLKISYIVWEAWVSFHPFQGGRIDYDSPVGVSGSEAKEVIGSPASLSIRWSRYGERLTIDEAEKVGIGVIGIG